MKFKEIVGLASRIKEISDDFITKELKKRGYKGIVPSHGKILFSLYLNNNKLTMKELAEKIHKTQATVTVLVDKLIDLHYIYKERSPEDGRVYYINLTEKGIDFKKDFYDISLLLNEKIQKNLTELESVMLEKLLEKVVENF